MRLALTLLASILVTSAPLAACTTNGDAPGNAVIDEPASPNAASDPTNPPVPRDPEAGADVPDADMSSDGASVVHRDAGGDSGETTRSCADYASPTTSAACRGCPAKHVCQPNGCFGSYWCEFSTIRCVRAPAGC